MTRTLPNLTYEECAPLTKEERRRADTATLRHLLSLVKPQPYGIPALAPRIEVILMKHNGTSRHVRVLIVIADEIRDITVIVAKACDYHLNADDHIVLYGTGYAAACEIAYAISRYAYNTTENVIQFHQL